MAELELELVEADVWVGVADDILLELLLEMLEELVTTLDGLVDAVVNTVREVEL